MGRDWSEEKKDAMAILGYASFITIMFFILVAFAFFTRCNEPKDGKDGKTIILPGSPSPNASPTVGCNKVTFEDLKPLITAKCVSCHNTPVSFDTFAAAKDRIDEMVRRISLSSDDPRRMPKVPKPELSDDEKALFSNWRRDGLLEDKSKCNQTPPNAVNIDIEQVETSIGADLAKVDTLSRPFQRYLVASDRVMVKEDIKLSVDAANKAINSLVKKNTNLIAVSSVDRSLGIWRIDLRTYDLNTADWNNIERLEPFNLVSNTTRGLEIRRQTNTIKPWLHLNNFVDTVNSNPKLYYSLLGIPDTFGQLLRNINVNFNGDIANFKAAFLGFNGSEITLNKNRLVGRWNTQNGTGDYLWVTFDTRALGADERKNLFQNPFLAASGSQRNFNFAAEEAIWTLPNSMQAYALFNNQFQRIDDADLDIVRDTRSNVNPAPVIANAISCQRCHSVGIITQRDQIRAHIIGNSSFNSNDQFKVGQLFRAQASLDALFRVDNKKFGDALAKLNISSGSPDPINVARDILRSDWTAQKLANFLLMPIDQFKTQLNGSDIVKAKIGQLLTDGTATFDEIVSVMPQIRSEFRIFEEKINGG